MSVPVRLAVPDDVPALARLLAEAFADYPWTNWTLPAPDRAARIERVQAIYLTHALAHGGRIWTTADQDAVAAFVPADLPNPGPDEMAEVLAAHGDRIARMAAHEEAAGPVRPVADWVLATAGVRPSRQGGGLGTAVLRAGLADISALAGFVSASVRLETSALANVRLYERLGFAVTAELRGDGPPVWVMSGRF